MELPTSSCHGVLYRRYYGLVGTSSRKLPGGSRRVVLLSPRVWKGCQWVGTRDWYLMHYSTPSITGGQKHTHGETLPINAVCIDGPDGRAVRADACAGWDGNAIKGWEGGHRGDRHEPLSRGKLLKCLIFVLFLS